MPSKKEWSGSAGGSVGSVEVGVKAVCGGGEDEVALEFCEAGWVGGGVVDGDVGDELSAGGGAVGFPEFASGVWVDGGEVEGGADCDEVCGCGS